MEVLSSDKTKIVPCPNCKETNVKVYDSYGDYTTFQCNECSKMFTLKY